MMGEDGVGGTRVLPTLHLLPQQVVYVFGFIHHHVFCAVSEGDVRYVPDHGNGIALWFGVTAFLFCVHSMVGWSHDRSHD